MRSVLFGTTLAIESPKCGLDNRYIRHQGLGFGPDAAALAPNHGDTFHDSNILNDESEHLRVAELLGGNVRPHQRDHVDTRRIDGVFEMNNASLVVEAVVPSILTKLRNYFRFSNLETCKPMNFAISTTLDLGLSSCSFSILFEKLARK